MDGLEIQFHFGNAKTFWTWLSSEKFFWSSPKRFGISKMKLDFQNIDFEFRRLGLFYCIIFKWGRNLIGNLFEGLVWASN